MFAIAWQNPVDAGRSANPWRHRAVDAIVTRFNIDSAFAHGQHGLGETGSGYAVQVVDCRGCEDVQLPGELVDERLVGPIYRFCGGSD